MIAQHDAEQLILRTWRMIDAHGGRDVEQLFAEAGVIRFGAAVNQGHDEIRLVYEQRRSRGERASRHLVANILWSLDQETLVAEYSMILFAADSVVPAPTAAPIAVFDVRDTIVDSDHGVLIAERVLSPIFTEPGKGLAVSFDQPAKEAV